MAPAGFQDVEEAHKVGLNVGFRVVDAVAYPCLCCKVDCHVRLVLLKDTVYQGLVGDGAFNKDMFRLGGFRRGFDLAEAVGFEPGVVIVVHVVQTDYHSVFHRPEQAKHKIGSDKARGAGDQYRSAVQVHMYLGHGRSLLYYIYIMMISESLTSVKAGVGLYILC